MAKPTVFEGPIPGQSLTAEPKNFPWEQPPQYADSLDALEMYMKRLADPDSQDELIDMLDLGIPISVITNTILSQGVMDGLHSVDVKLLLKGVLATQIQTIADVVGVDYKVSMADYGDKDALDQDRMKRKLAVKLELAAAKGESSDPGVAMQRDVVEFLQAEEEPIEEVKEETPVKATGIMAKEV